MKKITKNINKQFNPTMFTDGNTIYDLGGFLKQNAGTIGGIAGAAIGTMIAPGIGTSLGASIGGGLGGMVQNSGQNNQQPIIKQMPQNTLNQNVPTFGLGGNIANVINNGGTHENNPNSGVPVGNNALVEEGEFIFTNPVSKERYVFSNRLPFSNAKSYAQTAKTIEKKYKRYENDKIERDDLIRELSQLQQQQEQVKGQMQQETQMKEYKNGGKIMYKGGGGLGNWDLGTPNLQTPNFNKSYLYGVNSYNNTNLGYPGSTLNPYSTVTPLQHKSAQLTNNSLNSITPQTNNNTPTPQTNNNTPTYSNLTPDYWKSTEALLPLGVGIGANALMGLTAKEQPINYQRVSPNLVDLSREREIAQRMGDTSRNITSNQLRNVSNNSAEYMANLGAINPMINSVTGSQLAQSYQNQENTNAQIRNQTDAQNAQIQSRELEMRAQEKDAVRQQKLAALQGGMNSLSNYTNNVAQDRVQNQVLSSLTTDSGYGLMKDANGNMTRTFTGQGSNWDKQLSDGSIEQHRWEYIDPNNKDKGMREVVKTIPKSQSNSNSFFREMLNRQRNRQ